MLAWFSQVNLAENVFALFCCCVPATAATPARGTVHESVGMLLRFGLAHFFHVLHQDWQSQRMGTRQW